MVAFIVSFLAGISLLSSFVHAGERVEENRVQVSLVADSELGKVSAGAGHIPMRTLETSSKIVLWDEARKINSFGKYPNRFRLKLSY